MYGIKDRFGLKNLRGIIIARDKSLDLHEGLLKTKNNDIEFVPYMFSSELHL